MAKPDGSIIIDTAIETDGFKSGRKEIEAAARNMGKSLSGIGDKARIAAQKQIDAFIKANQAYAQQQKKVGELEKTWSDLQNQKVHTEEYAALDKELAKLGADFEKLAEKQQRYLDTGGKEGSSVYQRMEYDLDRLNEKQDAVIAKMKKLESSGKAYTTPDASGVEEKYLAALQKQEQMHARLGTSYEELKLKAESLGTSVGDMVNSLRSSLDNYERLRMALEELRGTAEKVFSPIQRLKDAFSVSGDEVSGYDKLDDALDELWETAGRVSESVRNSFEAIKGSPTDVIASLGDSVLEIGNRMNAAAMSAMGNAIESLGAGAGKIIGKFIAMGYTVRDAYDSAIDTVKEKMAGLAGTMINAVSHPIETLKNISSSAVNSIKTTLSAGVGNVFEAIKQKAAGVAASIINGILHPLQTLKSAHPALNRIVSILGNIGNTAKRISKSIGTGLVTGFKKIATAAKSAAKTVGGTLVSALKRAKSGMQGLDKQTNKTSSRMRSFFRELLLYGTLRKIFNGISSGAKEGLNNLVMYSDRTNASMSMLMSSLTRLKNSLATAFAPILNVVAPILSKFMDMLSMAATKVGMFFAALTGQKTMEQAIAVQQDYRDSLNGSAKAAKKAEKETDKYLSGLDEVRRWESNKDEDEEDELSPEDMFTTVPVDSAMSDLVDKVKDIFSQIFAPLKEAWNREGQFVMDSWKYALEEIWKLAKDIGRDFLKVWNQEATIAMLADMLHIIGDIGLVVGNLAGKFREAWNYNNTGLHILENIRDIFAVIIHNIREAADYTVEWTKTLDFRPLLQSVERLTASLVPFFDFVSGTLADFYTQFILPLTSWTLSAAGLPRLLNILTSFMTLIDWGALRNALKSLYQALEPYAEEIGNGLLDFIEKIKDEGVEFFNFLPGSIQRAADALRNGDLPAAFEEFGSISGEAVRHAFNAIKIAIESINWGEIGTLIGSFINGIDWMAVLQSLFGSITSAINGAIDLAYNFIMTTDWTSLGRALGANLQAAWESIDWQKAGETVGNGLRSILDFLLATVQELNWAQIGTDIGAFLAAIPWGDILGNVFAILGTVLGGLLDGMAQSLPGRIVTTVMEILGALKLTSLLTGAVTALFTAIFGVPTGTVLGLLFSAVAGIASVVVPIFVNLGSDLIKGLFSGITSLISNIGGWIKEHIVDPFINWFKKLFGIHSPSTVMQEMGKNLMQGLINGISSLISKVTSVFGDIKEKISKKWEEIKTATKKAWDNVTKNVKDSWESIKTNVKNGVETAKTKITTTWDNIKTKTSTTWENIKTSVKNSAESVKTNVKTAWDNAKTNTSTAWDNIKTKLSTTWDNLKTSADTKFGNIKTAVVKAWDNTKTSSLNSWSQIKSTLTGSWGGLRTQATTAFGNIASAVVNAWSGLKTSTQQAWNGLVNVIKTPVNSVIKVLNGLIRGVATCVNNIAQMLNSIHIDIPEKLGGGKLGFNLPTWTPGQIPYLASGAVIPPNKEFMAVLGDQKQGTNIEAPESLIRKIMREELKGIQSGGGSYRFSANINRRVLFDELIDEARLRQTVSGRNPFEMA